MGGQRKVAAVECGKRQGRRGLQCGLRAHARLHEEMEHRVEHHEHREGIERAGDPASFWPGRWRGRSLDALVGRGKRGFGIAGHHDKFRAAGKAHPPGRIVTGDAQLASAGDFD
jgi:hypothetical protein